MFFFEDPVLGNMSWYTVDDGYSTDDSISNKLETMEAAFSDEEEEQKYQSLVVQASRQNLLKSLQNPRWKKRYSYGDQFLNAFRRKKFIQMKEGKRAAVILLSLCRDKSLTGSRSARASGRGRSRGKSSAEGNRGPTKRRQRESRI
jgi:hypothetical protein